MKDFIIVTVLLAAAVVILIGSIRVHFRQVERDKYNAAAGNIIREDFLNYSLQNIMNSDHPISEPKSRKMMIYLKTKQSKQKLRYVFDPEKSIMIGRDKTKSNIYVEDVLVSQEHCSIYSDNNYIYLQDMYSANGTRVKRGLFKKYDVNNGYRILLKSGDTLFIGSSKFKVILFYYDISII